MYGFKFRFTIKTFQKKTNALSFYRSQNVLGWSKFFVPDQKIYLHFVAVTNILCQTKRWFAFSKIGFCASRKVFEEAQKSVKFLGRHKTFGPAQNILGPVKGQGINCTSARWYMYRKGRKIVLDVVAFSQIKVEIICCALIGLLPLQYIRKTNCDLRAGGNALH